MSKSYHAPSIVSDRKFETDALSCAKTPDPPAGSHHFYSAYDTWTGHLGPGFSAMASQTGSAGMGFGPGGTSMSYQYAGLCVNWVTMNT